MAKILALAALVSLVVAHPVRRANNNDVIIQMFQWNYDSIGQECEAFIGPTGYGYVQVSPAQETIAGDQWWTDYQPVSYNLNNKRGNAQQYQDMITKCHNAGVKVLADIIFNHMAGIDSGSGSAGSSFTRYNYPGMYTSDNFHTSACGTSDNSIQDWNNSTQVHFCELEHLADLATGTEYVQEKIAGHANQLLSLGVDGLRIDAAKHVPNADLTNIIGRLSRKPTYITQEVYYGGGGGPTPQEYTGVGNVQAFQYAFAMKSAFQDTGIASFQNLDNNEWLSSSDANTFVVNHDTERDLSTLGQSSPSNMYILGNVLMLAHPYGTPTVLSSYTFSTNEAGAPNGNAGVCDGNKGSSGWLCQHRWTEIAGMVGFHNTVGSEKMTNWVSPSSQQIAFGRGSLGYVAINNADSAWSTTFSTSLPSGTYCDVVSGGVSSGKCTGTTVTVGSDGTFSASVGNRNAIAIHTGAKL